MATHARLICLVFLLSLVSGAAIHAGAPARATERVKPAPKVSRTGGEAASASRVAPEAGAGSLRVGEVRKIADVPWFGLQCPFIPGSSEIWLPVFTSDLVHQGATWAFYVRGAVDVKTKAESRRTSFYGNASFAARSQAAVAVDATASQRLLYTNDWRLAEWKELTVGKLKGLKVESAAISPDGTLICFAARSDEASAYRLYLVSSGGTGLREIPDTKGCHGPVFAPNGKKVYCSRNFPDDKTPGSVWAIAVDGAQRTLLHQFHQVHGPKAKVFGWLIANPNLALSPDGSRLALVVSRMREGGLLMRLSIAGVGELNLPVDRKTGRPQSADSDLDIVVCDTTSGATQSLGLSRYRPVSIAWSGRGDKLAFAGFGSVPDSGPDTTLQPVGRSPQPLGRCSLLSLQPLYVADLVQPTHRVTREAEEGARGGRSQEAARVGSLPTGDTLGLGTGATETAPRPQANIPSTPAPSPKSGARLAAPTAAPAKAQAPQPEAPARPTDGLVVIEHEGRLLRLPVAGGELSKEGSLEGSRPVAQPSGSLIAFVGKGPKGQDLFVGAPDGSGLKNVSNLGATPSGYVWSQDGRKLAFVAKGQGGKGDIYVVGADGSGLTNVTNSPADDSSPEWGAGSRWLAFRLKPGDTADSQIAIWNSETGVRVVWSGDPISAFATSPQEDKIALTAGREKLGLYLVEVPSGTSKRVAEVANAGIWQSESVSFSPDGGQLAVADGRGISVGRADGTDLRTIAPDGTSPVWSPDGARLNYLVRELVPDRQFAPGAETEVIYYWLWGVAASGANRHRLWEARGSISVAGWTPDSSHVVFTIGEPCTGLQPGTGPPGAGAMTIRPTTPKPSDPSLVIKMAGTDAPVRLISADFSRGEGTELAAIPHLRNACLLDISREPVLIVPLTQ